MSTVFKATVVAGSFLAYGFAVHAASQSPIPVGHAHNVVKGVAVVLVSGGTHVPHGLVVENTTIKHNHLAYFEPQDRVLVSGAPSS